MLVGALSGIATGTLLGLLGGGGSIIAVPILVCERIGAQIIFGASAGATFPHLATKNGDIIKVGMLELKIYETPGHTPESICILARDTADTSTPERLFTGDLGTLYRHVVHRPKLTTWRRNAARLRV
jgi:hydroxyacylglutathione hydrolase